jgi:hypothetical protein
MNVTTAAPRRRRTAVRAPVLLPLVTLLLACASCPFAPAEPDASAAAVEAPNPLWREVFGGLARRADRGDAESARLALEMLRAAPHAYGIELEATPGQLLAWRCRAARREPPCESAAA